MWRRAASSEEREKSDADDDVPAQGIVDQRHARDEPRVLGDVVGAAAEREEREGAVSQRSARGHEPGSAAGT